MSSTTSSVYGYPLPSNCISFASERGRNIFKSALATEYMNCYFPLSSRFKTQEGPWACGISSLIMVLNALGVDPGVNWKNKYRWYHEDMLDAFTPETYKEDGISMDDLCCVALYNQLDVTMERVTETSSISKFREVVKSATSSDTVAIITSYDRNEVGQHGPGHFSPIGGYSEKEDMVLILDVARYKYPAHWLSISDLWSGMNTPDSVTGLNRGYMVLSKRNEKNLMNATDD